MDGPGEHITHCIDDIVQNLNNIKESLVEDVQIDEHYISILDQLELKIVNLKSLTIYRYSLLGSAGSELAASQTGSSIVQLYL